MKNSGLDFGAAEAGRYRKLGAHWTSGRINSCCSVLAEVVKGDKMCMHRKVHMWVYVHMFLQKCITFFS